MSTQPAPVDETDLRTRLAALTLEQKVELLTGRDFWALNDAPAAGLRRMVLSDGPAGVRGERWDERSPSANVPTPTALAATWDEERVGRIGHLLAGESRRQGRRRPPRSHREHAPHAGPAADTSRRTPRGPAAHRRYRLRLPSEACSPGASAPPSSTSWPMTPRPTACSSTTSCPRTHPARGLPRSLRGDRRATPHRGRSCPPTTSVNGTTMSEHSELLKGGAPRRVGLRRHCGLPTGWARVPRWAPSSVALDLAMPGPGTPGVPPSSRPSRRRGRRGVVDDAVLRLLRLAARVGPLSVYRPPSPRSPRGPTRGIAAG